jgi:cell division protein FtsZ
LKSPLIDRGKLLEEVDSVLVTVTGGTSMTLNEVQILMEELNRHLSDSTRILFGTAVDPKLGNRMSVTILTSVNAGTPLISAEPARPLQTAARPAQPHRSAPVAPEPASESLAETDPPAPVIAEEAEPTPRVAAQRTGAVAARAPQNGAAPKSARETKQEQMQFEPVTRGRFEKSEPTIVDGQDLDVPTFLRRNFKMK